MVVAPTWPESCETRECGSLRKSSSRPSSCIRSSVEGWMVSPRKSRRKSACFSSTATLTPARASRKPSIMPAGPPPAMQQVVVRVFEVMSSPGRVKSQLQNSIRHPEVRAQRASKDDGHRPFEARPSAEHLRATGSLRLLVRRAHDEPVEFVRDLDLARQPRVLAHVVAEIEHVLFHRRRPAGLLAPGLVDIDVAGRAGAGTAALRLDAGNVVADR